MFTIVYTTILSKYSRLQRILYELLTRAFTRTVTHEAPEAYLIGELFQTQGWEGGSSGQASFLESLYPSLPLTEEKEVCIPYPGKRGAVKDWKGVVVKEHVPGLLAAIDIRIENCLCNTKLQIYIISVVSSKLIVCIHSYLNFLFE